MEFVINHQSYNRHELDALIKQKLLQSELWEQSVYAFMKEWLSDAPIITLTTSGSTGDPKQITFPKSALIASAEATLQFFNLQQGDIALLCLPAQYVAAKLMIVRCFIGRMDLVIVPPSGNPLANLDCVIDFAALIPLQIQKALDENPRQLEMVKKIIIGGSAVSPSLRRALKDVSAHIWETYGMTETLTHVAVRRINAVTMEEYFMALPGVSFAVDERSCLVVNVARISALPVVTNDVVTLNGKSSFLLHGRTDDVINSGAIKIHPLEIEQLLQSQIDVPFVVSCVAHETLGWQIVLVVESDRQFVYTSTLFTGLQKYQQPRQIYRLEKLPRTTSGKILRKEVMRYISVLKPEWVRSLEA